MTDLCISSDIDVRLGRSLTETETIRVSALIADASASIRNYMRQEITEDTSTAVRLKVRNGRVRLPQRPVTAVASVDTVNGDPVLFTWEGFDSIATGTNVPDTFAWVPWLHGLAAVDVTYTHGYDPVPDDIIAVCCSIVMRALGREPVDAGITSESIASYSYSIGVIGAAGALGLLDSEKAILDTYCRVGGSINTATRMIT